MQNSTLPIVLGSSSKFRQKILKDYGVNFSIAVPDINEREVFGRDSNSTPSETCMAVCRAKANTLLKKINYPCILICCDQVVSFNGVIREKPESKEVFVVHLVYYKTLS
jgi:septum formation protein